MKSSFAFSVLMISSLAYAQDFSHGPPRGGTPPEIPQSAYTACSGKAQGDSVSDGRMQGTCEQAPNGQLALRPNGPPPDGGNGGPPPSEGAN